MTVLVTGAAGFVGSHLVDRLLAQGEPVVGLDNFDPLYQREIKEHNLADARDHEHFTMVEGDVREGSSLAQLPDSIDTIVHLAARAGVRPSLQDPVGYSDVNLMGTTVLLKFAKERGIDAFVFASSSSVYGNNAKIPFSEDDPVDHPISPYAATKRAGELLCHAHAYLTSSACTCLRFFTVYGPRQRPDLAIRKFSRRLLSDEEIPRFGDGAMARDYTYIDDITRGVAAALKFTRREKGRYEVINLGESRTVELSEMIAALGTVLGKEPSVQPQPAPPGDVNRTCADVSKAERLLGYRPGTDFMKGLEAFAAWYLAEGARQDGVG